MHVCCSTSVQEQQGCCRRLPESSAGWTTCSGNSWTGRRAGKKRCYLKLESVRAEKKAPRETGSVAEQTGLIGKYSSAGIHVLKKTRCRALC